MLIRVIPVKQDVYVTEEELRRYKDEYRRAPKAKILSLEEMNRYARIQTAFIDVMRTTLEELPPECQRWLFNAIKREIE